ncbi:MAG: helix-turn-helix transcriptional regulator [Microlunatus sp.]|nr:helix-turn-helix transcriptional regulator [Microlunatus sp.]
MPMPNTRLRAVRRSLRLSQAELARAVRAAGDRAGEPNSCSVTTIQRWEAGAEPRGAYLRALEMATGQPAENLGFASEQYGVDTQALSIAGDARFAEAESQSGTAPLNGIWRSTYEYESSGRGAWYSNSHYVMLLQQGSRLQVRSLPKTAGGRLLMDLTVNGQAITGTWTEETNPGGYYQGAAYHGAIQMLLEPSGRRMDGKWAGFGRDYEVNTGPWSLELVTHDTTPEAQEKYNRPVEASAESVSGDNPDTSVIAGIDGARDE